MLKSYLKVIARNLLKHKGFSLISVVGLAASMSVCLLIIVFVKQQLSYDTFHDQAGRIYHIYSDYKAPVNSSSHFYATSPAGLGRVMKETMTGVEDFISLKHYSGHVRRGEQKLTMHGLYASDSFFRMFNFNLISGDPETALQEPYSMVVTEATAERLFGDEDAMGATLSVDGQGDFKITGVVAKVTAPTLFEFEVLASVPTLLADENMRQRLMRWDRTVRSSYTFVLLQEGVSPSDLQVQFPALIEQHFPGHPESHLVALHMQELTDVAMGPLMDNPLKFMLPAIVLYILAGLACVILLAACFNYVSLSVARALLRAKEVGVRKVVGARRSQILAQFLLEAVCVSFLALLLAGVFLGWLIDGFNNLTPIQFTQSQVSPDFTDMGLYLMFIAFSLVVGLLSGLYPALYLSKFLPTVVLQGIAKVSARGFTLRKTLIVTQFALSLLFIISTMLLYRQSEHVSHTDYGFNAENILNVELGEVPYEAFRSELLRHPGVVNVSALSILTGAGGRNDTWIESEELEGHEKGYSVWIDEHLINNLEIPIVAGRNFSSDFSGEVESSVLLNEVAVRRLQLGAPMDAVGQFITVDDSLQAQVIGVVKDYRFFSALSDIDPLVLRMNSQELEVANIRFRRDDYDAVAAHLATIWESFSPNEPLESGLYEDQLADSLELKLMKDFLHIIGLSAGFAVLIACLGLLGMTAYMTRTRVKEIGVRKVLGATTVGIVGLLSKSFVKLIAVAIVCAGPLAWFVNNLWLQQIGNRIEMEPELFLTAILLLLLIAAITVGSQTVRAARTNPTEILKYE